MNPAHVFTDECEQLCAHAEYTHKVINHAEAYVGTSTPTAWRTSGPLKRTMSGTYLFRNVEEQVFYNIAPLPPRPFPFPSKLATPLFPNSLPKGKPGTAWPPSAGPNPAPFSRP